MSKNAQLFNKSGKDYGVSSSYGQRNLIVNGKDISGYHIGTDYLFPQGTELVLPVDVEIIGVNTGHGDYGGHVFAYNKHFNGTFHPAHMSRIDVKKGDIVKAGTVIGLSGGARGTHGAGTSTGAHLHIGWYAKGKKTDTGKGNQGDGQWIDIEKVDFTLKVEEVKSNKAFIKKGAKSKSLSAKYNNLSITNSAIGVPLDYELNKVKGKDWVYFPTIQTYVDIKDVDFENKPQNKPQPKPQPIGGLKVGDTVSYVGNVYATSGGQGKGARVSGKYKVTILNNNAYGVHLANLGWVKRSDVDPKSNEPVVKPFKPYNLTIKKGAYLYDVKGNRYAKPTTRSHKVTILEENKNLNQGRFKASWLVGVKDAWVKLS